MQRTNQKLIQPYDLVAVRAQRKHLTATRVMPDGFWHEKSVTHWIAGWLIGTGTLQRCHNAGGVGIISCPLKPFDKLQQRPVESPQRGVQFGKSIHTRRIAR